MSDDVMLGNWRLLEARLETLKLEAARALNTPGLLLRRYRLAVVKRKLKYFGWSMELWDGVQKDWQSRQWLKEIIGDM